MPLFKAPSIPHGIKGAFKTLLPTIQIALASTLIETTGFRMLSSDISFADYPNWSYVGAIDLAPFKDDIMKKNLQSRPQEEILEDQDAFMALSSRVILDLLENEPDTYTIDDVKVRFK